MACSCQHMRRMRVNRKFCGIVCVKIAFCRNNNRTYRRVKYILCRTFFAHLLATYCATWKRGGAYRDILPENSFPATMSVCFAKGSRRNLAESLGSRETERECASADIIMQSELQRAMRSTSARVSDWRKQMLRMSLRTSGAHSTARGDTFKSPV